jgi:signal transduction histidine kinase
MLTNNILLRDAVPMEGDVFLRDFVEHLRSLLQSLSLMKAGFGLQMEVGRGCASVVRLFPIQLFQVLVNLGSNSIKYATQLTVRVEEEGSMLKFELEDNGRGLSAEFVERLGLAGQGERIQDKNSLPGTGMGLGICKELLGRMGGQLRYKQREGGGASFEVSWFV